MKKFLAAILTLGLLFTGCGGDDSNPSKKHIEAKQLEQLIGSTQGAMFMGYDDIVSVAIEIDDANKIVIMTMVLKSDTNKEKALFLGDSLIRLFSINAVKSGLDVTMPTENNYGSLFDEWNIYLGIAPENAVTDDSKWYYHYVITRGQHTKQGPSNQRWR